MFDATLAGMRDNGLYATILGIQAPSSVTDVALQPSERSVEVRVALDPHVHHQALLFRLK